jgi:hypothetical protein
MAARNNILAIVALSTNAALMIGNNVDRRTDPRTGKVTRKPIEQHPLQVEVDGSCSDGDQGELHDQREGQSAGFDRGRVTQVETDDLVNGTGMIHGYDFDVYNDGSTKADRDAGPIIGTVVKRQAAMVWPGNLGDDARHRKPCEASAARHMENRPDIRHRIRRRVGGDSHRVRPHGSVTRETASLRSRRGHRPRLAFGTAYLQRA